MKTRLLAGVLLLSLLASAATLLGFNKWMGARACEETTINYYLTEWYKDLDGAKGNTKAQLETNVEEYRSYAERYCPDLNLVAAPKPAEPSEPADPADPSGGPDGGQEDTDGSPPDNGEVGNADGQEADPLEREVIFYNGLDGKTGPKAFGPPVEVGTVKEVVEELRLRIRHDPALLVQKVVEYEVLNLDWDAQHQLVRELADGNWARWQELEDAVNDVLDRSTFEIKTISGRFDSLWMIPSGDNLPRVATYDGPDQELTIEALVVALPSGKVVYERLACGFQPQFILASPAPEPEPEEAETTPPAPTTSEAPPPPPPPAPSPTPAPTPTPAPSPEPEPTPVVTEEPPPSPPVTPTPTPSPEPEPEPVPEEPEPPAPVLPPCPDGQERIPVGEENEAECPAPQQPEPEPTPSPEPEEPGRGGGDNPPANECPHGRDEAGNCKKSPNPDDYEYPDGAPPAEAPEGEPEAAPDPPPQEVPGGRGGDPVVDTPTNPPGSETGIGAPEAEPPSDDPPPPPNPQDGANQPVENDPAAPPEGGNTEPGNPDW